MLPSSGYWTGLVLIEVCVPAWPPCRAARLARAALAFAAPGKPDPQSGFADITPRQSLALLVDGVRLNSAQPQGAIASFMSLGLADRVEGVKGPASVLYGSGALGGVINVRLPQARFGPHSTVDVSAGLDSASSALRGSAVLRTSRGDHALMLGASMADVDAYEAPAGTVALSGYESAALIGQYRFRIDREQQLRASLQHQVDRDVWYPGSRKPHANAALVGHIIVHSPLQARSVIELGWSRQLRHGQAPDPAPGAAQPGGQVLPRTPERRRFGHRDRGPGAQPSGHQRTS